ncbi:hypothetical protein V2G26_019258 [Clonostachys chloroleuca]
MLYHGALNHRAENKSQTEDFMRRFYVQCVWFIPNWEKHATGSKADLTTAILRARADFQKCDLGFSWNMHKLVCLCAVQRNMHVLDKDHPNTLISAKPLTQGPT